MGVRAAMIPGNPAARLANRTAPDATAAMYSTGTFGTGIAEIAWANSVQSQRPIPVPRGRPTSGLAATLSPSGESRQAVPGAGSRGA